MLANIYNAKIITPNNEEMSEIIRCDIRQPLSLIRYDIIDPNSHLKK